MQPLWERKGFLLIHISHPKGTVRQRSHPPSPAALTGAGEDVGILLVGAQQPHELGGLCVIQRKQADVILGGEGGQHHQPLILHRAGDPPRALHSPVAKDLISGHPENPSLGSLQPFAQKREGITLNFKVGRPQRIQKSWVGSLALPTYSCHPHLPQLLLLLGTESPLLHPDPPRCLPGASSSAGPRPGPCCGRSRSSGHTKQRAWGQSRDTARCCQPT